MKRRIHEMIHIDKRLGWDRFGIWWNIFQLFFHVCRVSKWRVELRRVTLVYWAPSLVEIQYILISKNLFNAPPPQQTLKTRHSLCSEVIYVKACLWNTTHSSYSCDVVFLIISVFTSCHCTTPYSLCMRVLYFQLWTTSKNDVINFARKYLFNI